MFIERPLCAGGEEARRVGGTSWVLSGAELSHEQGHLVSDLGWGQGRFWGEGAGDESSKAGAGNLGLTPS